ncbi:MAG TPA: class I SAM-dependent methyltransferase [Tepidisphaeraceae bacterium]|nr:class I SAM-dependent methyltransferase [Tepidisphaeraceae bacterium]
MALTIFPDPVSGNYKDAGGQSLGVELQSLLTPAEYDSAKRTTFNAFYTSPTVISGIHEAITRLGVPTGATILEPGCGTGNFMSYAPEGSRFIGVEMDSISGRIAKALHPEHDIRIESFRDTTLPEDRIDAVVGNVPFADLKLDYRGQKLSLHDYFFAKSIDALKPGGVHGAGDDALHARQAERRHPRVPRLEGRFRGSRPPALRCVQAGRNRRRDRHRLPAQAGARRAGSPCGR